MKLLLLVLFTSLLSWPAQSDEPLNAVEKIYCVQATDHTDIGSLKTELLTNAKRRAVNEIFGELITAATAVDNFVVTSDQIRATTLGLIRIDGQEEYYNGPNLAEVCVRITAFTTAQDKAKFEPTRLEKRHCITEPDLAARQIKDLAQDKTILQALLDFDRGLEMLDENEVLRLMQQVEFLDSGFVPETETYCTKVAGYVIPIEITTLLELNESRETVVAGINALPETGNFGGSVTWIRSDKEKNLPVDINDYNSDSTYLLTGQAVGVGPIGGCDSVKGSVSLGAETELSEILKWDASNIRCVELDVSLENLDEGMAVTKLQDAVDYVLPIEESAFVIDITPFITQSGNYSVTWDVESDCCGILIEGTSEIRG